MIKYAAHLMTPQQRLKALYKAMLIEANLQPQEPLKSEVGAFALINEDIKTITVAAFIKMCVYKDYSGIILAGNPEQWQIDDAVESIMFQYHDALKDVKSEHYLKQVAQMNALSLKINRVSMNIQALSIAYYEPLTDELKADGYKYPFTEKTYLKDLERVKTSLKRDRIQYDKIKRELAKEQGKKGSPITEDGFYDMIAELRKFENYQEEPIALAQKLTIKGYCQALKRYNKHVEQLQKQAAKGK